MREKKIKEKFIKNTETIRRLFFTASIPPIPNLAMVLATPFSCWSPASFISEGLLRPSLWGFH